MARIGQVFNSRYPAPSPVQLEWYPWTCRVASNGLLDTPFVLQHVNIHMAKMKMTIAHPKPEQLDRSANRIGSSARLPRTTSPFIGLRVEFYICRVLNELLSTAEYELLSSNIALESRHSKITRAECIDCGQADPVSFQLSRSAPVHEASYKALSARSISSTPRYSNTRQVVQDSQAPRASILHAY